MPEPRCPHLVSSAGGRTQCRLAEFSLYALIEENARLRRGLNELRKIMGPVLPEPGVLSLEQVRLVEASEFLEVLLDHTTTTLQ